MNEIDVSDDGCSKNLEWTHSNRSKDTTSEQRLVGVRMICPDAGDEEHQVPQNHDRTPSELDRQPIGDEARNADSKDGPSQASIQLIVGHVELDGHFCEAGRDHWAPGAHNGSIDADDDEEKFFLPLRPVEWISRRFGGLRDQDDIFVAALCVLQCRCVTTCCSFRTYRD